VPVGKSQCTICTHDQLRRIDEQLVKGQSYRAIARRFDVSFSAVGRHAKRHLSPQLQALHKAKEHDRTMTLLERMESLVLKLEGLAEDAADTGKANMLLATARELRESYRLIGKLTGELDERPQVVNVLVSPEWQQVRSVLLQALAPYPEARVAVAGRLLELETGGGAAGPSALPVIQGEAVGGSG
jgi:hypothetical protein